MKLAPNTRLVTAAIAAVLVGAVAVTPVVAGGGGNRLDDIVAKIKREAKQRKRADQKRYTKTEADSKFTEAGEAYTKAEADDEFAKAGEAYTKAEANDAFLESGQIQIREAGPFSLKQGSAGDSVDHLEADQILVADTSGSFMAYLTEPAMLGGHGYRLQSLEVCYQLLDGSPSGDAISKTSIYDAASLAPVLEDPTSRDVFMDPACYTVAPASPYDPQGALQLELETAGPVDGVNQTRIEALTSSWAPAP